MRAGVSGFSQHPIMKDVEARPVLVAACPWFTPESTAPIRIADSLIQAVTQALAPCRQGLEALDSPLTVALLVNLPLSRPGLPVDLSSRIQKELESAFPSRFGRVALAQRGHAGALMALKSGVTLLTAGGADACVIAGADSYIDLETLEYLEEIEQLHGAGARNNAWGFVPGEGAGAVLLLRRGTAERLDVAPVGRIVATGLGVEKSLNRSGDVCLGLGLTDAFREAFGGLQGAQVTDMYCDMNGEPYRADEYGFAVTRTREHFVAPSEFVAPADCWGDVGAATGPLCLTLATIAIQKAYAKGGISLVWASSDSGERGAAVVVGG